MKQVTLRIAVVFAVAAALLALPSTPAAAAGASAARASSVAPAGPVNINTASAEELDALPGIGPALAKRIIEYRRDHGAFKTVDDLLAVKGIGPKMLGKIRDRLTVGTAKDAQ